MNTTVHFDTNNNNQITVETDKPQELKDHLEEHTGGWIASLEGRDIENILQEIFEDHGEFYDYIGFEGEEATDYYRQGSDFSGRYFQQFLKDFFNLGIGHLNLHELTLTEEQAQPVTTAIAQKIADICEDTELVENGYNATASSHIKLEETGNTDRLTSPTVADDTLLVTDDGAYRVEMVETEADGIQDLKDTVEDAVHQTYEAQLEAQVKSRDKRIERLETKLDEERQEMFIEGLQLLDDLSDKWKVEDGKLVYEGKIHPEEVTHRHKEDFGTKVLTEEAREQFYVENPAINITPTVTSIIIQGDAHHPHVAAGMCNGSFKADLREAPEKALDQLRQINLHDHNHTDAEKQVKENLEEWTKDADGTDRGEVWE